MGRVEAPANHLFPPRAALAFSHGAQALLCPRLRNWTRFVEPVPASLPLALPATGRLGAHPSLSRVPRPRGVENLPLHRLWRQPVPSSCPPTPCHQGQGRSQEESAPQENHI